MRKFFSQLLLLVGLTLMFNACGSDSSSDDGSTNFGTSTSNTNTVSDDGSSTNNTSNDGGSYSDGEPTTASRTYKGIFIDTVVEGLTVNSLDSSGAVIGTSTSGEDGEYDITEGAKSLEFKLGAVQLGVVSPKQLTTVLDVFRGTSVQDKRVQFAARILMSLDDDSDLSNGISISEDRRTKFSAFVAGNSDAFVPLSQQTVVIENTLSAMGDELELDKVYTKLEAIEHLFDSLKKLENKMSITRASTTDCPYGGIEKTYQVDFNNDGEYKEYSEVHCDGVTFSERNTSRVLPAGDPTCPYGGIEYTVTQTLEGNGTYSASVDLTGNEGEITYKSYDCKGYDYNASKDVKKIPFEANATCPYGGVEERVTLTKPDGLIDTQYSNIKCNVPAALDFNYTLASSGEANDTACPYGGVVDTYTRAADNKTFKTVTCSNDVNFTTLGLLTVTEEEANSSACKYGGKAWRHEGDFDNNGVFESVYYTVKCDEINITVDENTSIVKDLKAGENEICPYGGAVWNNQGKDRDSGEVIYEFNTTVCDEVITSESTVSGEANDTACPYGGEENITTITINGIDVGSRKTINCDEVKGEVFVKERKPLIAGAQDICPDGGEINVTEIRMGSVVVKEYNVTTCDEVTFNEINTSSGPALASDCPMGGRVVTTTIYRNHRPAGSYTSVYCNEGSGITDSLSSGNQLIAGTQNICPYGGEYNTTIGRWDVNNSIAYEYNSTVCDKVEPTTSLKQRVDLVAGVSEVCPYGGETNITEIKMGTTVLKEYNVTICDEVVTTEDNTSVDANASDCPMGGTAYIVKQYNNGIEFSSHLEIVCNESSGITETVDQYPDGLVAGENDICPYGGDYNTTKGTWDINGTVEYEKNTTVCHEIDVTIVVADTIELVAGENDICPNGGEYNLTRQMIGDQLIAEYNVTTCDEVEARTVVDQEGIQLVAGENDICPNGGEYNITQQVLGDRVLAEYNVTVCDGEDAETIVVQEGVPLVAGQNDICPYGGEYNITRQVIGDRVLAEYNVTTCDKAISTIEVVNQVPLIAGVSKVCPYGGETNITEVKLGGVVLKEYNVTVCDKADSSTVVFDTIQLVAGENNICPYGGEYNITYNKMGSLVISEYNVTTCYEAGTTIEVVEEGVPLVAGENDICPYGGEYNITEVKIGDKVLKEYNVTICDKVEATIEVVDQVPLIAGESAVCPYGGETNITQVKMGTEILKEYNVTTCDDVEARTVVDQEGVPLVAGENDICPNGGEYNVTQQVIGDVIIAEYNVTTCDDVQARTVVKTEGIELVAGENDICPNGGEYNITQQVIGDRVLAEYNVTTCDKAISTIEVVDQVPLIAGVSAVCPYGGETNITQVKLGSEILKEYNVTVCDKVETTIKVVDTIELVAGDPDNKTCPYGGEYNITEVRMGGELLSEYNVTTCYEAGTTIEVLETIKLEIGQNGCPYGGETNVTVVKIGDEVLKEYNVTECADSEAVATLVGTVDIPVDSAVYPQCGTAGGILELYETTLNGVLIDGFEKVICNEQTEEDESESQQEAS